MNTSLLTVFDFYKGLTTGRHKPVEDALILSKIAAVTRKYETLCAIRALGRLSWNQKKILPEFKGLTLFQAEFVETKAREYVRYRTSFHLEKMSARIVTPSVIKGRRRPLSKQRMQKERS